MSSLLPISEKGEEEEVDIVPSFDKVSNRLSYYEKHNGPNPVYQQYNRKGQDGIPINIMEPKQHTEIVENTLYDTVGVMDLEDEPVIVPITKPSTNTTDNVAPVYAVPVKKSNTSTSITSGFLHTCEDADVVPVSSYLTVEDVDPEIPKATGGHDMSIFVSKTKLDDKPDPGTEGDISASMDNDSDEVFTETAAANMVTHQQIFRADSIVSTTSDDRDLLNTDKKLKHHPKISHPKAKFFGKVNVAAKNTPSPKAKRANMAKSQAPTANSKGNKEASENDTNMAAKQQQKKEVLRTESILSTTSDNRDLLNTDEKLKGRQKISMPKFFSDVKAAIRNTPSPKPKRANLTKSKSPAADDKATQPVAKGTTDNSSQATQPVAKDTTDDSSQATLPVAKEHVDKHDYEQVTSFTPTKPQQNFKPTIPHKPPIDQKVSHDPKLKAHNAHHGNQPAASSPKLPKLSNPRMSPSTRKVAPTTGAYLNTSHPAQTNPLAQLRAKSSPRVKPRSAVQREVVDKQSQHLDAKPADNTMATHQVTKQQLFVSEPTREIKRSSIATDNPATNYVTDTAAADDTRRHTVCNLTFKEKRKQESDELDQALKDLDDLITTI